MITDTHQSSTGRFIAVIGLLAYLATCAVEGGSSGLPPLTAGPGNPRLPGKFVWADLVTDDALAAQAFYSGLFGWRFHDYGGYFIGRHDDRPVCGVFQRPRPEDRSARPRWFGYISVDNVGKAVRAVTRAGGREMAPAKKMPERGEQAVLADPEGALFGVLRSSSGDPEDFLAEPGEWIWIQLLSRDAGKASEFYRAVVGYEVRENTAADRLSDYVLTSEGYARATVRTLPPKAAEVQPTWLPFVRVKDVNESVAMAKKLGGKVWLDPSQDRFDGRVAVLLDPTGAAFGILEWSPEPPEGGR